MDNFKTKTRIITLPRGHSKPKLLDMACIFCLPGGNNNINVLDRFLLLSQILQREGHDITFMINGHVYLHFYLLTYGIYLPWACFVQPIHELQRAIKEHFPKCQEAMRKDVERAFGILQARWEIVKNLVWQWDWANIMMAFIIMHNMIIEDEQGLRLVPIFYYRLREGHMKANFSFHDLQIGIRKIENISFHYALWNDLLEHLWRLKGQSRP